MRGARGADLVALYGLAQQFPLLNLPADRDVIEGKIKRSVASFAGRVAKADAEYLFVAEEEGTGHIGACSMIIAKSGTPNAPSFSFLVLTRERHSPELGIGFSHPVLRLRANLDGPTEVGGLVVGQAYRRRPEKLGRLVSLSRFIYIKMFAERFEAELHAELAPTLGAGGQSDFWDAIGQRLTGMTYQEADRVSQQSNSFIPRLFPEEDIYVPLLDAKVRPVLGQVGSETRGALKLLADVGFKYKDEVDPFDGGPHLGCLTRECSIIGGIRRCQFLGIDETGPSFGLVGLERDGTYVGTQTTYSLSQDSISLPAHVVEKLQLNHGEFIFLSPEATWTNR